VSASIARFRRSFGGHIEFPTAVPTRRGSRESTGTHGVLVTAKPTRVAVDETAVRVNGEWSWSSAAIDVEPFSRRGTNPAAAFLHRLREKHDRSATVFLVVSSASGPSSVGWD